MKLIAYWTGTAQEFANLTFAEFFAHSSANMTMINGMKSRKLEIKHL